MQNPNFPPTFFAVGGDDGIWDWVMGSFDKVQEMGITTEIHTFAGVPHAFGAGNPCRRNLIRKCGDMAIAGR